MSATAVNLVTAFGRGESLALALAAGGFRVQVLDFTSAFGPEWQRGAGPFPLVRQEHLPAQKAFVDDARLLERGLTLWLSGGPIELGGRMAEFFAQRPDVRRLKTAQAADGFSEEWLARFLSRWASSVHLEAWEDRPAARAAFPAQAPLGLIAAATEERTLSFERYRALGHAYESARTIKDIHVENQRLTEIEVDQHVAKAPQWIWCLSSEETRAVSSGEIAARLFARGPLVPEWRWLGFRGRAARGPWTAGFPTYSVVIDDVHLPWVYENTMVLRWIEPDQFHAWMRVPASAALENARRAAWAEAAERSLARKLPLAEWRLDPSTAWLCPHSPVFAAAAAEEFSVPGVKNWDWIAPERLARLDFGARLAAEAESFKRLSQWKTEQLKKQGARGDHALHAP